MESQEDAHHALHMRTGEGHHRRQTHSVEARKESGKMSSYDDFHDGALAESLEIHAGGPCSNTTHLCDGVSACATNIRKRDFSGEGSPHFLLTPLPPRGTRGRVRGRGEERGSAVRSGAGRARAQRGQDGARRPQTSSLRSVGSTGTTALRSVRGRHWMRERKSALLQSLGRSVICPMTSLVIPPLLCQIRHVSLLTRLLEWPPCQPAHGNCSSHATHLAWSV